LEIKSMYFPSNFASTGKKCRGSSFEVKDKKTVGSGLSIYFAFLYFCRVEDLSELSV
jgi:hypothetical protein